MICERVNGAGSFSAIKYLMFYSLLCIKTLYGFRKLEMQHDFFCFFWSIFAINTSYCTYFCLCVFYIVQSWVCFGAGKGIGAPIKVKIYKQLFLFFYKSMKTIKGPIISRLKFNVFFHDNRGLGAM